MTSEIIPRTHDKRMPIDDLMKLVEAGDWDAKAIYAARLFFGDGFEEDQETALKILNEAHQAGSVRATAELSFRSEDPDQSEEFAALAIERGNHFGWLSRMWEADRRGDYDAAFEAGKKFVSLADPADRGPDLLFEIGAIGKAAKRHEDAVPFYKAAAEGGSASAAINLALMITWDECELPKEMILDLYRQAASFGSPAGAALFADELFFPTLFEGAHDPDADPEMVKMAIHHLLDIMERWPDYHYPYYYLAAAFEFGFGYDVNLTESTRLLALSAQYDTAEIDGPRPIHYGRASLEYAHRLHEGIGTEPDLAAAFAEYERAFKIAEQGNAHAGQDMRTTVIDEAALRANRIALSLGQSDYIKRTIPMLQRSANTGNEHAILPCAIALHAEGGGFREAREYFVLALALGVAEAGVEAATRLIEMDEPTYAFAFAQAAAALDHPLPAELAALDGDARGKGILFMKGKSGHDRYKELAAEIVEKTAAFAE